MKDTSVRDMIMKRSGGHVGATTSLIEAQGQLPHAMLETFCERHILTGAALWEDYMERKGRTKLPIYPFSMYILEVATEILSEDTDKGTVAAQ